MRKSGVYWTPRLRALITALLLTSLSSYAETDTLLLKNVRPVDALDGERELQDLLIRGGRIVALGSGISVPDDTRILDAGGRHVIPGLWDMHVHLTYDKRLSALMPDLFLDYGITSVRDTGGLLDEMLPIVEAMRSAPSGAPRVFFAGPLMDGSPVVYDGINAKHIGIANPTPEAARANVKRLAAAGVDFLKIYEMVSPEVFAALVTAAREANLPIAAHVPLSMLASDAGPAVNSMEHLRNIEMDCATNADALLLERRSLLTSETQNGIALRGQLHQSQRDSAISNEDPARCAIVLGALTHTIQVPTARLNAMTQYPPFRSPDWSLALDDLPPALAADWRRAPALMGTDSFIILSNWTLSMIPRLRDAGVPIGAGTDTPIGWAIPGYSLHSELEILVQAGLTPQQALHSATRVPASFFDLESEMGLIRTGYVADLVIVDGSPLQSISNTRRIHTVIANGRIVRGPGGT